MSKVLLARDNDIKDPGIIEPIKMVIFYRNATLPPLMAQTLASDSENYAGIRLKC